MMRHNFYTKLMNVDYFLTEGSCDRSTALVSLTRRSMKALVLKTSKLSIERQSNDIKKEPS